jgi:predicted ATPase/DNA-binding SARP family transcriptional activator
VVVVEVELLGPPAARTPAGRQVPAGRQRALLAVLALHAPRPVPTDRLVAVVWGEGVALPGDPANALQQRISALRRIVDPDRRGDVLVPTSHGYALHLDDHHIDARRFAALAAEGRALLTAGDDAAALERLTAALSLWHGPALDGVADEPWAVADATRLTELRLGATEDRLDAALRLGQGPELIGELGDLVAAHPLRERLCGQAMLALYRADRQAEALVLYDRTRRRLADELGVDPGPALQARYRQVLDQAAGLDAAGAHGDAPHRDAPHRTGGSRAPAGSRAGPPPRPTGNLPARTSQIVGRDDAIAQVLELLGRSRLVTLTGPGGAGKTTLALEAARIREPAPDGTWLVELAPVTGDGAVVGAVAAGLGIQVGGTGGTRVDGTTLTAAIADRELLVVLDNCEHLVAAVARLVERLLAGAAEARVLATSRAPLGIAGEVLWPVPALRVPAEEATDLEVVAATPAVQLLAERARAHDPGFALTSETAPAAAQVVRRLDGIPLAIELAAARLRVLSLPELAAGLSDRFALLTSRRPTAPSRQRTLRGALDWSFDLLDGEQRTAWLALSVPVGWFDRSMAVALLDAAGVTGPGDPVAAVDLLHELVDRSLVMVDTSGPATRYRLLETIRDYGRDRLAGTHLDVPLHVRHADVVEAALIAAHRSDDPAAFPVDLDRLEPWLDEARAALDRAAADDDRARIQRLAGLLGWLWLLRGLGAEGLGWLDRGLAEVDPAEIAEIAEIAERIAPGGNHVADATGGDHVEDATHGDVVEVDPAAALWASALRLTDPAGPDDRWAAASIALAEGPADRVVAGAYAAVHHAQAGRMDAFEARLRASEPDAVRLGGWPLGFLRVVGAQVKRLAGLAGSFRQEAEEALAVLTDADVGWARILAIDLVIDTLQDTGEYERGAALAEEGLALCRGHRFPELESRMHLQLGNALQELGELERARHLLARGVELATVGGRGAAYGYARVQAGSLARRRGDLAEARDHLTAALAALGTSPQMAFGAAWAHLEHSAVAAASGDRQRAEGEAMAALAVAHGAGLPGPVARALEALAGASAVGPNDGDAEPTVALLAAAAAVRRASAGASIAPWQQRDTDRTVDTVRQRLGHDRFDVRWTEEVARIERDPAAAIEALLSSLLPA